MAKSFKWHCKIINYLHQTDPELADLIENLCLAGSLAPRRDRPGVTFLLPDEKAYRDEIFTKAHSSDIADVNNASDMINACILQDVFKTTADFAAKKDDIPNCLHPAQTLKIESTTPTEVVFGGGAKASVDSSFKDSSHKANLAVWRVKKGRIPVTVDQPASLKHKKGSSKDKVGGYAISSIESQNLRQKIAIMIENSFALYQLHRRNDPSAREDDPYYRAISTLINYAEEYDSENLMAKYAPLQSAGRFDFYILVEPHRVGGEYILSDSIISGWWEKYRAGNLKSSSAPKFLGWKAPVGTETEIAAIRLQVREQIDTRPRNAGEAIEKVYRRIAETNSIGSVSDVYPAALNEMLKKEPLLQLVYDELRYVTHNVFTVLISAPVFDLGSYNELINGIGECLHPSPSPRLLSSVVLRSLIAPKEVIEEIKTYVLSSCFIHVPNDAKNNDLSDHFGATVRRKPKPGAGVFYDINGAEYEQHERLLGRGGKREQEIAETLSLISGAGIAPDLVQKIKSLLQ